MFATSISRSSGFSRSCVPAASIEELAPGSLGELFARRGALREIAPDATVFLHGMAVGSLYMIVSGTVRCCTITECGRRQIFRFAGPGEFLGLAELETWHFTAEAVRHVTLRAIPRRVLEEAVERYPALHRERSVAISKMLAQRERLLFSMAFLGTENRLLAFLADYSAEAPARDGFTRLPMTRQDIGDHLGMSFETVSRGFTALRRTGRIEMKGAERYRLTTLTESAPVAA